MLSFPVSYILLQSLGHSVYMSTGSKVTFSLAIGALGWGMWDDGNSSRNQWKASSSTEMHGNSYYGLSGFLYSRVWKHSKVILTFFLFLRVAGFAFEQRSVFSRSSISTRTCENGLLAICSISTNNLWTTKCILHILHIKLSNIIVLYYKYPRNKGSNSEQSWKTPKSMTVMGSIYSSLLEWNKDAALTLIRWQAMPWLRQSVVSLTVEAQVWSQNSLCRICGEQRDRGFSERFSFICYMVLTMGTSFKLIEHMDFLHCMYWNLAHYVSGIGSVPIFRNCFFKNKCYYIIFIYTVIRHGLESH